MIFGAVKTNLKPIFSLCVLVAFLIHFKNAIITILRGLAAAQIFISFYIFVKLDIMC